MTRWRAAVLILTSGACLAPLGCADPVHDDLVKSLGPESSGVPPGPLHRPGQPCLACHGGSGPASSEFTLAGTVYAVLGQKQGAMSAVVHVEDIIGQFYSATTNSAGNFYVVPAQFAPHFPIQMNVTSSDGAITQTMLSVSARDGSCADCHVDPQSSRSPGPVYLAAGVPTTGTMDGGTE